MSDNSSVKVAVRIRPLVQNEIRKGCREILDIVDINNQIIVKSLDKAFTFNYVLGPSAEQSQLYDNCVKSMIDNLFKGYNVTILAYGQTGSGKTHSMGTTYSGDGEMGVIPRAVSDIFNYVRDNFTLDFTISVSFMELYQEVLYDLLSDKPRDKRILEIREDVVKGIHIPGLTEVPVTTTTEVLSALSHGSVGRATASTNMNSQSSRSHAIFTISICMQNKDNCLENKMAKLHLVDLAGSERPKKTGAVGNTFKEGVNINKGLFVLGNVISSLGDENKQNGFVPYRDSNLTRLLKDSLGGNSITLMIACVSPADYNVEETLSTLRYADRARRIKNKPIVNQDAKTAEINELKKYVQQLKLQIVGQGGAMVCPAEIELLKKELSDCKLKIRDLTLKLSCTLRDNTGLMEKIMILQNANEALNKKMTVLKDQYDITFHNLSNGFDVNDPAIVKEHLSNLQSIQNQFVDITNEQKKVETEIRKHEESLTETFLTASCGNSVEITELHEQQESHATKQIALNTELQEISNQLTIKQHLAQQLLTNVQYMVDYNGIAENEEKISALQKEKEELVQQLKATQGMQQGVPNKLAEQRRKRVQELEAQIHDLHRKVLEQAKLIKLKEKDEIRIRKLNQEITQMKQTKVKLVRSMREESDKFRQWKLQRERELAKLKHEDRKKESQIVKMLAMHSKQQNVFKRKVEEAAAVNKRLKDALAVRKQAQETKNSGKVEKIGNWLKQEYNFFVNIVEAKATLTELLEDRGTLQQQLDQLKADPETVESQACKTLEEDIEVRSLQIQDLQQKILDSDEENKSKTRFDNIQTMAEAKFALKSFFEQSEGMIRKQTQKFSKLNELHDVQAEMNEKVQHYEQTVKLLKEEKENEMSQLQKSYEEKVACLLRQLRGVKVENVGIDEELEQRCDIQQEKIDAQEKLIQELTEKLRVIDSVSQESNSCKTPEIVFKPKKKKVSQVEGAANSTFVKDKENMEFDTSIEEITDDVKNDPDWRKTPLGKRILEEKRKFSLKVNSIGLGERLAVKRSSEGGCTCKTSCSSRCGCRKLSKSCSSSCKCNPSVCINRSGETSSENGGEGDNDSKTSISEDDSFKKPRLIAPTAPLDDDNLKLVSRKRTKTRILFDN